MSRCLRTRVALPLAISLLSFAWQLAAVTPVAGESLAARAGRELDFRVCGTTTLSNTCDYDWWYGCSPTAAGMIMGHYDRNGYGTLNLDNLASYETLSSPVFYTSVTWSK